MFQEGFPVDVRDDVNIVVGLLTDQKSSEVFLNNISPDSVQYIQDTNVIQFPYRLYLLDTSETYIEHLNDRQRMVLHCIYSRSFDGYVRENHLLSLLQSNYEDWVIPYIVKLCDEYVLEIIEMTYNHLRTQDTERIKRFCMENRVAFSRSYDRMPSYWNEYHRYKYKNFQHYVGRKLFRECFGYSNALGRRARNSL
ncbi:hypothetical protein [Fictibacillus nanhaiensis]|uniref:hypothetical protein n=1 Tax=Fictibacillus nanhaiensis TaxID=742169 RepID=UPI003C28A7C2